MLNCYVKSNHVLDLHTKSRIFFCVDSLFSLLTFMLGTIFSSMRVLIAEQRYDCALLTFASTSQEKADGLDSHWQG